MDGRFLALEEVIPEVKRLLQEVLVFLIRTHYISKLLHRLQMQYVMDSMIQ
jgi:hypothetical protein